MTYYLSLAVVFAIPFLMGYFARVFQRWTTEWVTKKVHESAVTYAWDQYHKDVAAAGREIRFEQDEKEKALRKLQFVSRERDNLLKAVMTGEAKVNWTHGQEHRRASDRLSFGDPSLN